MGNFTPQMEMNIAAYEKIEDELLEKHFGKTALMHDGELIDVFDELGSARKAGEFKYGDNYSVKVIDRKVIRVRPTGVPYRPARIGTS